MKRIESKPLSSQTSSVATRKALLDAAEELLPQKGVAGTSVRDIANTAGTNLAAVNYHFGSKDYLIAEVILRRLRPVDSERLARIDALEKAANGAALKLNDILDALIRPAVESPVEAGKRAVVMRLIEHAYRDPDPCVRDLVNKEFVMLRERFNPLILRALPELAPGELFWRSSFLAGGLHYMMEAWSRFDELLADPPEPRPNPLDREQYIQRAVAFMAAVLSAPVPDVLVSQAAQGATPAHQT